uniref:Uncharacterized protein n=1 Tax=Ditylenchus dipsaci TaxID=166011 RepID=A0A915EHE0_9BILA
MSSNASDNKKKVDPKAVVPVAKPFQKPAVKPVAKKELPKKQAKPVVKVIFQKASSYLEEKKPPKEAVDKTQSNSSKPNHFNEDKWQERKAQTKTIDVGELATVTMIPVEPSMRSLVMKNRVIRPEDKDVKQWAEDVEEIFQMQQQDEAIEPSKPKKKKSKSSGKKKKKKSSSRRQKLLNPELHVTLDLAQSINYVTTEDITMESETTQSSSHNA